MALWLMIAAPAAAASLAGIPLLNHAQSITLRPISANVVMCASPNALPLARLAQRLVDRGGPDYGVEKLMDAGGCILSLSTDAVKADFQEDVIWAGAVRPPTMLHGTLRVIRLRFSVEVPGYPGLDAYFYAAADDLKPA